MAGIQFKFKIILLNTFLFSIITTVLPQSQETVEEKLKKELIQIRIELKEALLKNDIKILDQIWHNDYILTTRTGKLLNKIQRIASLQTGKLRYMKMKFNEPDLQIRIYGHTAVVTGLSETLTNHNGTEIRSGPKRFTEVWIYQNESWRMVARQASPVEQ